MRGDRDRDRDRDRERERERERKVRSGKLDVARSGEKRAE